MQMKLFAALFLALVLIQSLETYIVRLPPTAFPELPAHLVQELQRRQCTIPQEAASETLHPGLYLSKKPTNVIKGEFARPGQTDWAVLCSVKGLSTILVFWNGSEENPAAIVPAADRNYVQIVGGDQDWAYSRRIEPLSMADILRVGIRLPTMDHQGIEDAFVGKAFLVWYYYNGQWLKGAGGD